MKYFSEILNKNFDTVEELKSAEDKHALAEAAKRDEANKVSKEKKELSTAIDLANDELDEALDYFDDCKNKAREIYEASGKEIAELEDKMKKILEKSNKEAEDILNRGKTKVREAKKKKADALKAFISKYGSYSNKVTGEDAEKEFRRLDYTFNSDFNKLFKDLFSHWYL